MPKNFPQAAHGTWSAILDDKGEIEQYEGRFDRADKGRENAFLTYPLLKKLKVTTEAATPVMNPEQTHFIINLHRNSADLAKFEKLAAADGLNLNTGNIAPHWEKNIEKSETSLHYTDPHGRNTPHASHTDHIAPTSSKPRAH